MIYLGWTQSLYPLHSMSITSRDLSCSGGGGAIKTEQISLNPSTITTIQKSINLHTQLLPTGISLLSLSAIYPNNNIIYFTSISNLNFGTLKDGISGDTFSANDLMINCGLKKDLFYNISIGTSLSYSLSQIKNLIAQSILFSTGLRLEIIENQIGFGLTLRNIGHQFDNFRDGNESIPYQLQVSGYMKPKYLSALIFSDIVKEQYFDSYRIITGIEFYARDNLTLRISHSGLYANGFKLNGFAFGTQFNWKSWTIDLASQNLSSVGFSNSITLSKKY